MSTKPKGHDSLVYDGASFAVNATDVVVYEATRFAECVQTRSFGTARQELSSATRVEMAPVATQGMPTLALAVKTLGADNMVAVTMPSKYSSEGSVSDSAVLCRNLGIKLREHPIQEEVAAFERSFQEAFGQPLKGIAAENLQS
jgi:NAD+ synthase (glutamine-hydrolysing)